MGPLEIKTRFYFFKYVQIIGIINKHYYNLLGRNKFVFYFLKTKNFLMLS